MHYCLDMSGKYLLQYRLLDLIEDVESSISIKDIREKHKVPTTHGYSMKSFVDSCTQGKVEAAVVVRTMSSFKIQLVVASCYDSVLCLFLIMTYFTLYVSCLGCTSSFT